jgi:glyceraldehyde-3-phosphate dehydrogenase type I
VHGRFGGTVEVKDDLLVINGDAVAITAEPDPAKIDWRDHDVDIVLECTGRFRKRDDAAKHLTGGAKKVLLSAPGRPADATLCCGVNHETYDPDNHHVISNASCTTNCLAPVAKVLHDEFEIVHGIMTTIHSVTNDQRILDLPHKDLRRARAACESIIPTTTGAAVALKLVIPDLEGKLDGMAIRVPTANVSIIDLTIKAGKPVTEDSVKDAFRKAAEGSLKGYLAVSDEPLVSRDYNGNKYSAIVDLDLTRVMGDMVKAVAWYDNEAGYSQRLFDVAKLVAARL